MKKNSYKGPKGASFRTYFHGNAKTNGCSFQKVKGKKINPDEGKKGMV